MMLQFSRIENPGAFVERQKEKFRTVLALIDGRLVRNEWLAGEEFTVADIMTVFTLTTMRMFYQFELTGYEGILAYLERVTKRDGYRKARAKADPELELMVEGKPPRSYAEKLKADGKA